MRMIACMCVNAYDLVCVQFFLTATLMGYSYSCAPIDFTYATDSLNLRVSAPPPTPSSRSYGHYQSLQFNIIFHWQAVKVLGQDSHNLSLILGTAN